MIDENQESAAPETKKTWAEMLDGDFDAHSTPSLPPKSDQSLRDRIAAAIMQADEAVYEDGADPFLQFRPASYDDLADAVIAELGLRQEWQIPDDRGPGAVIRNDKPAGRSLTRYTTEWKPNDE